MPSHRKLAIAAGALYLVTFATSIPALALKDPYLADTGAGSLAELQSAAFLEILLAFACIGTALAIYPVGGRFSKLLALGFVASRTLEAAAIFTGVTAMLAVSSLREAGVADAGAEFALIALHDWAFLIGPGIMPIVNALLFGTLLLRARLVPRWIPVIGLIGAPLLAVSSFGTLFGLVDQVSILAAVAAAPIAVWEFSIGLWLLVKGFNPKAVDAQLESTAHAPVASPAAA